MSATLRQHMRELHPRVKLPRSNKDLERAHGRQHWRFWMSHDHAGENLGPDKRPSGWKTGEDVVMRRRS